MTWAPVQVLSLRVDKHSLPTLYTHLYLLFANTMFDPLYWTSLPHIEYTLCAPCYRNFQDSEWHGVSGSPWIPALPHERDRGYHQGRLPPTCVQTLISLHSPYLVLCIYMYVGLWNPLQFTSKLGGMEEIKVERAIRILYPKVIFSLLSYLLSLPYPLSFLSLSPSYYYPSLPHPVSFIYLSPFYLYFLFPSSFSLLSFCIFPPHFKAWLTMLTQELAWVAEYPVFLHVNSTTWKNRTVLRGPVSILWTRISSVAIHVDSCIFLLYHSS